MLVKRLFIMVIVLGLAAGAQATIITDAQAAWWFGDGSGDDLSGNNATYVLADGAGISGGKVNISGGTQRMELGTVAGTLTGGGAWTVMLSNASITGEQDQDVLLDIGSDGKQNSIVWFRDSVGSKVDIWYKGQWDITDPLVGAKAGIFLMYDGSLFYLSSYDGASWTHSGAGGTDYGSFSGTAALGLQAFTERNADMYGYNSAAISAEGVAVWSRKLTEEEMGQALSELGKPRIQFESASSGELESVSPAQIAVVVPGAEAGQTYTVDYAATGGTATGGGVDYTLAPGHPDVQPGPDRLGYQYGYKQRRTRRRR